MLFGRSIQDMLLSIPALIIALTIHEFCHGYAAYLLGDKTAKWDGRLSFNPLRHLDPLGSLMILLVGFGWAKPVMVNPYNLRNPKRDMAFIALAGPVSNFITAFFTLFVLWWLIAFDIGTIQSGYSIWRVLPAVMSLHGNIMSYVYRVIFLVFQINIGIGLFNLIPIPPLDGSKILGSFLPHHLYFRYMNFRYWLIVLVIMLITVIPTILGPFMMGIEQLYSFIITRFLGLFF